MYMGNMDKSKHSSTIAIIAAVTAVTVFLLLTPVLFGMYNDTNKSNYKMESKIKEVDRKLELLDKKLEQLNKEK